MEVLSYDQAESLLDSLADVVLPNVQAAYLERVREGDAPERLLLAVDMFPGQQPNTLEARVTTLKQTLSDITLGAALYAIGYSGQGQARALAVARGGRCNVPALSEEVTYCYTSLVLGLPTQQAQTHGLNTVMRYTDDGKLVECPELEAVMDMLEPLEECTVMNHGHMIASGRATHSREVPWFLQQQADDMDMMERLMRQALTPNTPSAEA